MAWLFEFKQSTEGIREAVEQLVDRRRRATGRDVVEILRDPDIRAMVAKRPGRRLLYIGKPNHYRALEAQRFLRRRPGEQVVQSLEIEFDRAGVVFSRVNGEVYHDKAYTAYHPHSGTLGPVDSFSRRAHIKRIGGLTLYSFKERLSQEELDMYYAWYAKAFKKQLRRPKGKALDSREAMEQEEG